MSQDDELKMLRKQVADLQVAFRRLQAMVHGMGGGDVKEDPYEDEHHPQWEKEGDELPKVPWGNDR